jgi:hypothetical protein
MSAHSGRVVIHCTHAMRTRRPSTAVSLSRATLATPQHVSIASLCYRPCEYDCWRLSKSKSQHKRNASNGHPWHVAVWNHHPHRHRTALSRGHTHLLRTNTHYVRHTARRTETKLDQSPLRVTPPGVTACYRECWWRRRWRISCDPGLHTVTAYSTLITSQWVHSARYCEHTRTAHVANLELRTRLRGSDGEASAAPRRCCERSDLGTACLKPRPTEPNPCLHFRFQYERQWKMSFSIRFVKSGR